MIITMCCERRVAGPELSSRRTADANHVVFRIWLTTDFYRRDIKRYSDDTSRTGDVVTTKKQRLLAANPYVPVLSCSRALLREV